MASLSTDNAEALVKAFPKELRVTTINQVTKPVWKSFSWSERLNAITLAEEAAANVWSASEDRALTRALVTFKASMNKVERWECIAEQLMLDVQSTKTPKQCKKKFNADRAAAAEIKASGGKVADASTAGKREKKAIPEEAFGKKFKGKKGKKNHAKAAHKGKKAVVQEPEPEAEVKEEAAAAAAAAADKDEEVPAAPKPVKAVPWSNNEQRALEKALKAYPISMDKKERWLSISKAVNASGEGGKSVHKCQARFKNNRAESQRTAGQGNKDDRTPEWKKKQAAEKAKAKGYHTTTQNPDERKQKKNAKSEEGKNKFKEAAKTQGTGKKKKKN